MISKMGTVSRAQTIVRFPVELMERLKYQAKRANMLDEATAVKAPRLREVSEEDRAWAAKYKIIPAPTKEQLDADPKLAHITNKGIPVPMKIVSPEDFVSGRE